MSEKNESYFEKGQLPSLDQHGQRVGLIPAEITGPWKSRKKRVHALLMLIFLAIPWTSYNGIQTVLLNIPQRHFTFFGTTLWAHEAPLIFLVLIIFVLGLFAVTAVWGRVWCGWACPQTVFIEFIYRPIEVLIEGNYIQRRKANSGPWTGSIISKKILKWILYFIVSSFFAHSFAAYFIGARDLITMMKGSPAENWVYFIIITFTTAVLLFDFGWFREQFCIIMCPYGRFQSALLDSSSMVVQYNTQRGEPRRGLAEKSGDCVDCHRCVQVCPTGIDIRYGLQMECIACTACMDACDTIMEKVNKPKGLISYNTLSGQAVSFFKPRALFYTAVLTAFATGLVYLLSQRGGFDIGLLRAKEEPYQMLKGDHGEKIITNHFKAHIKNQSNKKIDIAISLPAEVLQNSKIRLSTPESVVAIEPGQDKLVHLFVIDTNWNSPGEEKLSLKFNDQIKEITLIGPEAH